MVIFESTFEIIPSRTSVGGLSFQNLLLALAARTGEPYKLLRILIWTTAEKADKGAASTEISAFFLD